ncbi:MAG: hypothetical protein JWN86_3196 [Planctomycetota bacterium]|nr:hypothetical protein [Planctomycetota bacterium]
MMPFAALVALALSPSPGDDPAPVPSAAEFAALGADAVQDLVILGATRPILLRVRVRIGDLSFRAAWAEATRTLHAQLDRDGDGRLTVPEAEANGLSTLLGPAAPTPAGRARAEVDFRPKDGVISVEELAEGLRSTSGPFRLRVDGLADRRTDLLFDHLDRDKDGRLARSEMESLVGSLNRLDRDADELIDAAEVNLLGAPVVASAAMMLGRRARDPAVPPVLELAPGESPVRLARMLIKRYDTGSSRGPGQRDSKLSPEEFAIPAGAFRTADISHDGTLNAEELRGYLAQGPRDAILDVALSPDASGRAVACVRGDDGGPPPAGISVRQLAEAVVEIDVGLIRLDIHIDDGATAAEAARTAFRGRFAASDANGDGYLEEAELTGDNGQPSPLAGLFKALDRDADGKLYPGEMDDFIARQAAAARGRLTLTASDEGRALFGLLDTDCDRRLGAREVLDAFARISACDRDRDGRVTPEEVPHHIQLTLARGDLSALIAPPGGNPAAAVFPLASLVPPRPRPAAGPAWFRKMDRNRDGDVSRREFLGTRDQFDRLDRDHDGLIAPNEAEAATPAKRPGVKAPGG